ncbi:hypothetical protein ACLKA7_012882 [Drosophila subpalustris]
MPDVEMPEELDIDREDLSLSNEIVESDEDNREAIVYGDGREMESNSEFAPNVHSTPVCTGTLDLQRIVEELRREFNDMKADRERERVEMDALRQKVAELNSRVATLEAARGREAEEGRQQRPFTDLNDFLQFERSLESDDALQNVIRTIGTVNTAQSSKEWVTNSWHPVLSDDVGSLYSWTGIRDKQCIRDLRITLAMRRYRSPERRFIADRITSPASLLLFFFFFYQTKTTNTIALALIFISLFSLQIISLK